MDITSIQKKNAIFMVFEKQYLDYGIACLGSIISNYNDYPDILISYEEDDPKGLERILNFPRTQKIVLDNIDAQIEGLDLGSLNSKEGVLKFFAWSPTFEHYDKVLYLNTYCLVFGSLHHLFESNDFYIISDLPINALISRIFKPGYQNDSELDRLLKEDGLTHELVQQKMANAGVIMIPPRFRTNKNWIELWQIFKKYNKYLLLGDQSAISIWCALHDIQVKNEYENNFQTEEMFSFHTKVPVEDLKQYFDDNGLLNIIQFNALKPHATILERFRNNYTVYWESYKNFQYYLSLFSTSMVLKEQLEISDISLVWIINSDNEEMLLTERSYLSSYLEKIYFEYEMIIVEYGEHPVFQEHSELHRNNYHYVNANRNFSEVELVNFSINLARNKKVLVFNDLLVAHPKSILKASKFIDNDYTLITPHRGDAFKIDMPEFMQGDGDLECFLEEGAWEHINRSLHALENSENSTQTKVKGFCFLVNRVKFNLLGKFDVEIKCLSDALNAMEELLLQEFTKTTEFPYALYSFRKAHHLIKEVE